MARSLLVIGRTAEAAALADEELVLARRWGTHSATGSALTVAGQCHDREDLLREAVEQLASSPARLEQARALLALGMWLRRHRHALDARRPLREALDLAHACGAAVVMERAREELVAAGARPRRDAATGRHSLTARELRVAELASRGHTNRQIAEILYLSRRTVEHHLRNCFHKLGIDTREQLQQALAATRADAARGPAR